MNKPIVMVALLFITFLSVSCFQDTESPSADNVVDPNDLVAVFIIESANRVDIGVDLTKYLKSNNIEAYVEGSLTYGLSVTKENVSKTIDLVLDRVRLKQYAGVRLVKSIN